MARHILCFSDLSGLCCLYEALFLANSNFFLILVCVARWGSVGYSVLFVCTIFTCFFIPADTLTLLQGSRDVINTLGRGVDENQRTAFVNLYSSIDGGYEFLMNYIYAFVYLNFPIFFFWDLPALVLTLYVISCSVFFRKYFWKNWPFLETARSFVCLTFFDSSYIRA